jgi:hypothetical protein
MAELLDVIENRVYRLNGLEKPHACPNCFLFFLAYLLFLSGWLRQGVPARVAHGAMYAAVSNAWFAYEDGFFDENEGSVKHRWAGVSSAGSHLFLFLLTLRIFFCI